MVLLLFKGDPYEEPFYMYYPFQRENARIYHEGKAKIDIVKFSQLIDNMKLVLVLVSTALAFPARQDDTPTDIYPVIDMNVASVAAVPTAAEVPLTVMDRTCIGQCFDDLDDLPGTKIFCGVTTCVVPTGVGLAVCF
jgi:hypothetical protein